MHTWKQIFSTSFTVLLNAVHLSWGNEFKENNRLTRIDWKVREHTEEKYMSFFLFHKLIFTFWIGLAGYMWMCLSDFYKMIEEQDFNRNIDKTFHFVPYIACVHAFSISK